MRCRRYRSRRRVRPRRRAAGRAAARAGPPSPSPPLRPLPARVMTLPVLMSICRRRAVVAGIGSGAGAGHGGDGGVPGIDRAQCAALSFEGRNRPGARSTTRTRLSAASACRRGRPMPSITSPPRKSQSVIPNPSPNEPLVRSYSRRAPRRPRIAPLALARKAELVGPDLMLHPRDGLVDGRRDIGIPRGEIPYEKVVAA
jgi:hypothetical protein